MNRLARSSLVQGVESASRVVVPRVADEKIQLGRTLYRQFNQFPADRIEHVLHDRQIPRVVVGLGELTGIIYRSDKWHPGQPRTYIHFLDDKPKLVSNVEGTQLYVVGGNYRITSHGIEG